MKEIFLLLFGIIVFGLGIYFSKYYKNKVEHFQVNPSNIITSDIFLNNSLPRTTITFPSFSICAKIKNDFLNFITDWHNFSGYTDRVPVVRQDTGETQAVDTINLTYTNNNGKVVTENIGGKDFNLYATLSSSPGYNVDFHVAFYWNALRRFDTYWSQNVNGIDMYPNFTSGPSYRNRSSNTYLENFTKFVNKVGKEKLKNKRIFLMNYKPWDLISLSNYTLSSYYNSKNLYNLIDSNLNLKVEGTLLLTRTPSDGTAQVNVGRFTGIYSNITSLLNLAQNETLQLYIYGTFCNYHSNDFSKALHWGSVFDFTESALIDMYLNIPVYDSNLNGLNINYSYGMFFPEIKSKSINQPYIYIPNNVCISNNTYLHSLYTNSNILKLSTTEPTIIYDSEGNINSITYNNLPINQVPTTNIAINASNLREQYVGRLTPQILSLMPNTMHRYITSWAYNRTLRLIDVVAQTDGTNFMTRQKNGQAYNASFSHNYDKASYLIGLAYNNLTYFRSINSTPNIQVWDTYLQKYLSNGMTITRRTDKRLNTNYWYTDYWRYGGSVGDGNFNTSAYPNPEICALGYGVYVRNNNNGTPTNINGVYINPTENYRWYIYSGNTNEPDTNISDSNGVYYQISGSNSNLVWNKRSGYNNDQWDLSDITINNMVSDFKINVLKVVPNYGTACNINILDQKTLDSIAQSFYEYSDGLFEINFIYDMYIIGSNMIDIRFDKKQRLGPVAYISLRNQYQPQIIQYNSLLSQYEQGTWVDKYSNVNDILSNISTAKQSLDPILNPVYTISNRNPNDIRAEISQVQTRITNLTNQMQSATLNITSNFSGTSSSNSNYALNSNIQNYISNLLNTPNSDLVNVSLVQQQIDSNTNYLYQLSNQLDGIETNVARLFITMNSSNNFTVNGIALGPNAALTYNPIYNGGLEVDMGQSQGNVNYSPTILYTKNVPPLIDPESIDFMKTVVQMYTDAIPNSLSSFTRSIYPVDSDGILLDGRVYVDAIYGSSKLDDLTCGFTWKETQYDYFTNEPKNSRIVNLILKLALDNTEYQNPVLYIDNQVSSIYINSNVLGNTTTTYVNQNNSNISNYRSFINSISNQLRSLDSSSIDYAYFSSLYTQQINNYNNLIDQTQRNINYITSNIGDGKFKFSSLKNASGNVINATDILYYKDNLDNIPINVKSNIDTCIQKSNIYLSNVNNLQSTITSYNLMDVPQISNRYPWRSNVAILNTFNPVLPYSPVLYGDLINVRNFYSTYKSNYDRLISLVNSSLSDYNNQLPYLTQSMSNLVYSNIIVKILQEPKEEDSLDNNDGACPANITCGNPRIMNQLMDSYNLDSNNSDKIIRIFKAFTPNPYQCDYSVEIADSNGSIRKGTISFQVAQDIADCSYYITSNTGFNKGYYIIDKVKYVVDISGYSYVNTSLYGFSNAVKNTFTPLITSASNTFSNLYNTLVQSRTSTYNALGKIQSITINNCPKLTYEMVNNLLINKGFANSIFQNYPYLNSHINKIYRFGIRDDNTFEIVFEKLNLVSSNNRIISTTRETAGAIYSINVSESYCDYTPIFVRNTVPFAPSNAYNMSNIPSVVPYESSSDLNIVNTIPIQAIDPTDKKLLYSIVQYIENKEQYQSIDSPTLYYPNHQHIRSFNAYRFISESTIQYSVTYQNIVHLIDQSYENATPRASNPNLYNKIIEITFSKGVHVNDFIISNYNSDVENISLSNPATAYLFTTLNKPITSINFPFDTPTAPLNFQTLLSITDLPSSSNFIRDNTNPMACEYFIQPVSEVIPFSKMFYKVIYYYDELSNAKVYSINSATPENSFYLTNPVVFSLVANVFSDSQRMRIFNLNANTTQFIDRIQTSLSNLRNNTIVSLQYVKTDYNNLTNTYVVAVWPQTTPITIQGLMTTTPTYIYYTLMLSNIQSADSYNVIPSTNPVTFTGSLIGFSRYPNNIYFKNGIRTVTSFSTLEPNVDNCYYYFNALNLIPNLNNYGLNATLDNFYTGSEYTYNGVVAYKNNDTSKSYDYILQIDRSGYPTYIVATVTLTPINNVTSCVNYLQQNAFTLDTGDNVSSDELDTYISVNGFTTYTPPPSESFQNYVPKKHYIFYKFESSSKFKINNLTFYDNNYNTVEMSLVRQSHTEIIFRNKSQKYIHGYSFITNNISSELDPISWSVSGTNNNHWIVLDKQNLTKVLPRDYQLPLFYFDGTSKVLPQPQSSVNKEKINKELFIKYYKQKINPSYVPDYKKILYDNDNIYLLYDEYDLNRNKVNTDLIIGFEMKNGLVKKAILYEDNDGSYKPFNLRNKSIKQFWDKHIMLPLAFQDF